MAAEQRAELQRLANEQAEAANRQRIAESALTGLRDAVLEQRNSRAELAVITLAPQTREPVRAVAVWDDLLDFVFGNPGALNADRLAGALREEECVALPHKFVGAGLVVGEVGAGGEEFVIDLGHGDDETVAGEECGAV